VRIYLRRLRQRVATYYAGPGAADPLVLGVTCGPYRLSVECRRRADAPVTKAPRLKATPNMVVLIAELAASGLKSCTCCQAWCHGASGRRLNDVPVIMDLHELAPVSGRATSGRHRRRDEIGEPVEELKRRELDDAIGPRSRRPVPCNPRSSRRPRPPQSRLTARPAGGPREGLTRRKPASIRVRRRALRPQPISSDCRRT
jgi:hypothetical protein